MVFSQKYSSDCHVHQMRMAQIWKLLKTASLLWKWNTLLLCLKILLWSALSWNMPAIKFWVLLIFKSLLPLDLCCMILIGCIHKNKVSDWKVSWKSWFKKFNQISFMFHTAYYVTKEGLPFLKYEGLCELEQLNSIWLAGENQKTNNTCKRSISLIASSIKGALRQDFNTSHFVTIMSDGSTDKDWLTCFKSILKILQ